MNYSMVPTEPSTPRFYGLAEPSTFRQGALFPNTGGPGPLTVRTIDSLPAAML
jgi:hypothetical protein